MPSNRINRIKDPVLKNRIRVGGEPHPFRIWIIVAGMTIIIPGLIWGLIHFYPTAIPFYQHQTLENKPPLINSASTNSVTPLTLKPLNGNSVPQPNVVNPTMVNDKSVQTSPPNVVNPTTVNDKSVQTSPPNAINSTMTTKVESPTVATEAQSTTFSALAVPKPFTNQSQVRQTSSPGTEISSPVLAATNKPSYTGKERKVEKAEKVEQLLAQAENQFNKERFTSPVGDNAYETYQQLLAIAPLQAQIVLDKIIAWYYHQGKKYLDQGKITKPSVGNAYQSYQRMQEITPSHPNAQALLDDIINSLTQQLERQLEKNQLASTKGSSAYTIYQELVTVAPNHEKVPSLQSKIVDRLMQRAKQQEVEKKYSEPNGDNAVDTYKDILKLVPNHQAAIMELEELVQQQYYQRAVRFSMKEDYETCMKLINKGLKILPDHTDLNELKKEVQEKMSH